MKQGRASATPPQKKIEPKSKAASPAGVGKIGSAIGVARAYSAVDVGRGYKAPAVPKTLHRSGTQGKY